MTKNIAADEEILHSFFDTLRFTKRATEAGFTLKQAEFQAAEVAELVSTILVTRSFLRREMRELEARLQAFQTKITWVMLGGISALLSVGQILTHFFQ